MRVISLFAMFLALSTPVFGMGKKPDKMKLSFHIEGHKTDNPKMIFPYQTQAKQMFFQRTPIANTKDLVALKPFPAEDGTFGAVFQLSQVGAKRLAAATTQAQGKWMLTLLNGKPTDSVYINNPVRDGKLVIWQGLTRDYIMNFDFMIPRIGMTPEQWKAHKKELKKRRKK